MKNKEELNEYQKQWRLKNKDRDKEYKKRYYEKNKEAFRTREKAWRKNNPLKTYESLLKCRYGISLQDYNNMLLSQNRKCRLCEKETKLFVDHCHSTGKIRGLLCNSCNKGLGLFYDNKDTLQKALNYLKENDENVIQPK